MRRERLSGEVAGAATGEGVDGSLIDWDRLTDFSLLLSQRASVVLSGRVIASNTTQPTSE